MPIYEYRCEDCEQIFEEWQKNFEEKQACCPVCGSNAERIISNTSFILKGSGWYVTDYCDRKPSAGNGNGSSGKATEAAGSSESAGNGASTESKPAAQAPPAAKDTKKPAETKKADTSSKSSTTGTS
jgi:putative FmdB family regulatory protein